MTGYYGSLLFTNTVTGKKRLIFATKCYNTFCMISHHPKEFSIVDEKQQGYSRPPPQVKTIFVEVIRIRPHHK